VVLHLVLFQKPTTENKQFCVPNSPDYFCGNHDVCPSFVKTYATGVAYMRSLMMMILEHMNEIGTRRDVPRFGPSQWR
jgi:hypothetical protein